VKIKQRRPLRKLYLCFWDRDSVVGIASRLGTGNSEVRIPEGVRDLSFVQNIHISSGDNLTSYSTRSGVSSPGLKQPRRETNQLHKTNADVKNEWSFNYTPLRDDAFNT